MGLCRYQNLIMMRLNRIANCFTLFKPGKLFLWSDKAPQQMKFDEKIIKASVGPHHIALVSENGNVYTAGENKTGQLGHGNKQNEQKPKMIEYFYKNNIKISCAICGEKHTIALDDKGQVYTFGYGGKQLNWVRKIFSNPTGPLGHGDTKTRSKPRLVSALADKVIKRVTAGRHFNLALTQGGDIYNWGIGQYGAFGDGYNSNYFLPEKNSYIDYLKDQQKVSFNKIKSCESFSIGLSNQNKLYGWGSNESGQMGIKAEIGVEMYETVNYATEVIREGYEDQKVTNFDISDTNLIFQLQNNQIWWSGMKIAYKPQKLPLPEGVKIEKFAAGQRCLVTVDSDNQIYQVNGFIPTKVQGDVKTGIQKLDGNEIFGGKILAMGGQYSQRYAIIADEV